MNAVIFRLWRLSTASSLVSWLATKTFISALYMNDTMLVTGDYIPIYITQTPVFDPELFISCNSGVNAPLPCLLSAYTSKELTIINL